MTAPTLRVAHVLNELRPSGAEAMLASAAAHWRELGVEGIVIATGPRPGPYAQPLRDAGYEVHHVPVGRSPAQLLRFRAALARLDCDLVHQHVEGRGYWLALLARSLRLPVLRTVHSHFAFDGNLRLRRRWQRWHLRRLGVRFAAISPSVQENETRRFANPCELVWNWIDVGRFAPLAEHERRQARERLGLAPRQCVIASVGNCAPAKNHEAIIGALARLGAQGDLHYLHAGVEDAQAGERRLARECGVGGRIAFLGWTPDVRAVLAAADVFVMPSRYEGFALAALEAIALGVPTLLADVPGLRDWRRIFPAVRYCEPDAGSLAQALAAWMRAGLELPAEVKREQADICRRDFGPARGAQHYARLYRELAGLPRATGLAGAWR